MNQQYKIVYITNKQIVLHLKAKIAQDSFQIISNHPKSFLIISKLSGRDLSLPETRSSSLRLLHDKMVKVITTSLPQWTTSLVYP